jgi:hypothetical protein
MRATPGGVTWGEDTIVIAEDNGESNVINEIKRLNPHLVEPFILNINQELYGTSSR